MVRGMRPHRPAPSSLAGPSRRRFLKTLLGALAAGAALPGCREPYPYPMEVPGYAGLAGLPFFALDAKGRLRLRIDVPPITDVHAHLGIAIYDAPDVDLGRATPRTQYLMDCDAQEPPCTVKLDVYLNLIATPAMLDQADKEIRDAVFSLEGSKAAATHTIPNLLGEMDALRIERAVLLPIAAGLSHNDTMTEKWRAAVASSGHAERFVSFCSVYARHADAVDRLRAYHAMGYRGLKFHPTMQQTAPDDPAAMTVFMECRRLGMPVFLHAGRAGIEPDFVQGYAEIDRYVQPITDLPDLPFVFGHSGARDFEEALGLARDHDNVWMDTQGQGVSNLRRLLDELGPERLVFGSDWPWYPQAASLAKVLIVTDDDPSARDLILCHNARRLLGA